MLFEQRKCAGTLASHVVKRRMRACSCAWLSVLGTSKMHHTVCLYRRKVLLTKLSRRCLSVAAQITTTLPVRTTFYSQVSDITRIVFEVALHLCLAVVLSLQVGPAAMHTPGELVIVVVAAREGTWVVHVWDLWC